EVSRAVPATLLPPLGLHLGVEVPVAPVVKSVGVDQGYILKVGLALGGVMFPDYFQGFGGLLWGESHPGWFRAIEERRLYRPPSPASPSPPLFTRHEHRGNKTLNWDLKPSWEILIVGASNIARLPLVRDSRVQVDSFPGANLSQAATLIRNKTPTSPGVQQVVLSFGLNDRDKGNPTLLEDNFLRLWNAARETFPNAVIYSRPEVYQDSQPFIAPSNMSLGEHQALEELQGNMGIILKPADKGGSVVIMDRGQYIREAMRQLEDPNYCLPLESPMYEET
ncbi:hypothetical protein JOQ06_019679, partial [Pogonophryne albipinna]